MTLPADIARCNGVQHNGQWREGCEGCSRRTSPVPPHAHQARWMSPPPMVTFECEGYIEPGTISMMRWELEG